jgi:hypothetical protein
MEGKGSAREALIAEMLGDIGKLHDAVEHMKQELPSAMQSLTDLNLRIEKSHADLIAATEEARSVHQEHIADLLIHGKAELEAIAKAEARQIKLQTEASLQAAFKLMASGIEREIKDGLSKSSEDFKAAVEASITKVKRAASEHENELKRSAARNAPLGIWPQVAWMVGSVVFTAIFMVVVLIYAGVIPLQQAASQSAEQQPQKAAKR